jgi:hypothetical protein
VAFPAFVPIKEEKRGGKKKKKNEEKKREKKGLIMIDRDELHAE